MSGLSTPPEDVDTDVLPGTVHLVDLEGTVRGAHASGAQQDIVLVPSPSADPDDPLNWSPRRKWMSTIATNVYTLTIGIASAAVYSVLEPISRDTGLTVAQLNAGTGYMFLMFVSSRKDKPHSRSHVQEKEEEKEFGMTDEEVVWNRDGVVYFGRLWRCNMGRGQSICSLSWQHWQSWCGCHTQHQMALGLVSLSITCDRQFGLSVTDDAAGSKMLQGFVGAPIESLCEISVTDVYFTHERGTYMGIYAFVLAGGNYLSPVLAGFINDGQGQFKLPGHKPDSPNTRVDWMDC